MAAEEAWPEVEALLRERLPVHWWELAGREIPCTWGMAATAARRSFLAARTSGTHAAAYGRLACALADALTDTEMENEEWRWELKAYALAATANGLRVLGHHELAWEFFTQATAALEVSKDPADFLPFRSEIYSAMASLCKDQGRYQDALDLLAKAEEAAANVCYRPQPGFHLHLETKRAYVFYQMGQLAEAESILREAEATLTARTPRGLYLGVARSLMLVLLEQGKLDEAESRLPTCRRLLEKAGGHLEHVRVDWTEARLHLARGRRAEARALFERVRDAFLDRRMALDVALVTLELALALVQEGEAEEAAEQALAVQPDLERLGLADDAAAAMRIAWEAARTKALEAAVLEELVAKLRALHRGCGG